jgi:transcriptional regulator with XRE-family HTH domain
VDKKSFGLKLAQIRLSKNISAYQLSLKIGKASNYINSVERGKVNISLEAIIAICEELGINPSELFTE